VVFSGLLLYSAYSPYINPEVHPIQACFGMVFPVFLMANILFLVFWLIVSYKLALVPFIALLLCAVQIKTYIPFNIRTQEKNIPENSIKFLSYNVMGFNTFKKNKGENHILNYIKNSNADIVCLQEYASAQNRKYLTQDNIDNTLTMYPYKHIQRVGSDKRSTIFMACYSKYPILSSRTVNYRSSHNGSIVHEIKVGDDVITVINNHFESNKLTTEDKEVYEGMIKAPEVDKVKSGATYLIRKLGEAQSIRAPQARAVAEEVAKTTNPHIIVCGDFNDTPVSYVHRVASEGLDDAFVNSGNGLGISYNRNLFFFRIDNILTSKNLKAWNCTVDRSIKESDHYPIWCYISKK
ncbi:endonuclease/exonuclease/phosphatase family protein, partial [Bacteroides sp. OttesenSCG-928-D19]|nr:endonuclease/exonuclease/phosphatase family protein [Bacteroides sp. OttesenSCG-928-D19]